MEEDKDIIELKDSKLEIATIGSRNEEAESFFLKIDYVIRLEYENEYSKYVGLTAADYYYESIQLIIMDQMVGDNYNRAFKWITFFDLFRDIIYVTFWLFKLQDERLEEYHEFSSIFKVVLPDFDLNNTFRTFLPELIHGTSKIIADIDLAETDNHESGKLSLLTRLENSLLGGEIGELSEELRNIYDKLSFSDKKNDKIKRVFEKKRRRKGCIALAIDLVSKQYYFSLSGSSIDCVPSVKKIGGDTWKYIDDMRSAYNAIKKTIKFCYRDNKGIKGCHLTSNVRRYVDYSNIYKYLNAPIRFVQDVQNKIPGNDLKRHYSCCERKILAYIVGFSNPDYAQFVKKNTNNILSDFKFIIRFEPCDRCKPALLGCNNIIYGKITVPHSVNWNGTSFVMV